MTVAKCADLNVMNRHHVGYVNFKNCTTFPWYGHNAATNCRQSLNGDDDRKHDSNKWRQISFECFGQRTCAD